MATITPRTDKDGKITSYLIRVYHGYDQNGKRLKPYTLTWKPDSKMTARQVEKELKRQEIQFEEQCKLGYALDNRQTFEQYADYVINLKKQEGVKESTLFLYKGLLKRINAAIGSIKIADIRPQHLNSFYQQLGKDGMREGTERAKAKPVLAALIEKSGFTREKLAEIANLTPNTITVAKGGQIITKKSALAIAMALNVEPQKLFTFTSDNKPLSNKTIVEHHRFISTVLAQAEKEMLILYNPAAKASPPKVKTKEANYFEPAELEKIRDCLQKEPLKWQVITHLLIVTGCRRGEIMGLKWSAVDLDKKKLYIRNNLLYAKDFGIYQDTTKTETSTRTVPVPDETVSLLREYRNWWIELRLKSGSQWQMFVEVPDGKGICVKERNEFLFLQEGKNFGYPMRPDSITDYLSKFSKRQGLPHINPHAFRHTLASMLGFNGIDITTISKWLGHNNVTTTVTISYGHTCRSSRYSIKSAIHNYKKSEWRFLFI